MGYGIINTQSGTVAHTVPFHSGAGEWATLYYTLPAFWPTNDIYVSTALNFYVCGRPGTSDGAAVGIKSFVDAGQNNDSGTNPGSWWTNISTTRTTSVTLGYYLSGNASGMRASWQTTYWGDDGDRSADRNYDVQPDWARVVYDRATGRVRHVELRRTRGLVNDDQLLDLDEDPVKDARDLGHAGDLAVLEVSPEEFGGMDFLEVDVEAGRLVRTPMVPHPGADRS